MKVFFKFENRYIEPSNSDNLIMHLLRTMANKTNSNILQSYRPIQNLDECAFIKSFLSNNRAHLHPTLNLESLFDSYLAHIADLV